MPDMAQAAPGVGVSWAWAGAAARPAASSAAVSAAPDRSMVERRERVMDSPQGSWCVNGRRSSAHDGASLLSGREEVHPCGRPATYDLMEERVLADQ